MKEQLFTPDLFEKGKKLYENKLIWRIKQVGNVYHAIVHESENYHVTIAFDSDYKVIDMNCRCANAKNGKRCAHEAAVFIAIHKSNPILRQKRNHLNERMKQDNNEVIRSVNNYKEHSIYLSKTQERIKFILKRHKSNEQQLMLEIQKLYNEFQSISYSPKYKNAIINTFKQTYSFLINHGYSTIVLDYLKKVLINENDLVFFNEFQEALQKEGINQRIQIVMSILNQISSHTSAIVGSLFNILKDMISSDSINQKVILDQLSQYANTQEYQMILIEDYVKHKQYNIAQQLIEKYNLQFHEQDNIEFLKLEFKIYFHLKEIDKFEKLTLDYMKYKKNYKDLTYLHQLKKLYNDQWSEHRCFFYDQLKVLIDPNDLSWILNKENEYQYMIYLILDSQSFTDLQKYANNIQRIDSKMYIYLYTICLYKYMEYSVLHFNYYQIRYYIGNLKSIDGSQRVMEEVVYTLLSQYSKNNEIMEVLEDCLKGDNEI